MSIAASWTYRVLGEVTAERAGEPLDLTAPKPRLLLALLAMRPKQVVSIEQLIGELWPDPPPASARTLMHGYVSSLRKLLEPNRGPRATAQVLTTRPPGYALDCEPNDVDAFAFEEGVRQARDAFQRRDVARARDRLTAALALWRGPAFGSLADVPALQPMAARLEELRLSAVEDRVMLDLREGREATLVTELERLVEEHPLRERLWSALILALYRRGRQADALDAYRRVAGLLRDELGADPGSELARTHEAVLRHEPVADVPRTAGQIVPPPRTSTALVGRRDQLALLSSQVADHRMVTLIGPGGCGKTRLAQELAHSLESATDVAWVDLAPVRDPTEVASTAVAALGLVEHPQRDPVETLVAQLADGRLVVVLDNCEHLVDMSRRLAHAILERCPNVRILATSRTALRVRGESWWQVPPLDVPPEDAGFQEVTEAAAVQLFVGRARDTRSDFALTADTATDVASICRKLEGNPLSIELAAAWVPVLDPAAILEGVADPLAFLTRGSPASPDRQQTLRATIAWSHQLLAEQDRHLFERLSVFAGPFSVEAAAAVGVPTSTEGAGAARAGGQEPAIRDGLANLVGASLLSADQPSIGPAQFRMLDTVRQFGRERLESKGALEAASLRHAEYVQDLVRRANPELYGPDLATWLRRVEDVHGDIRNALRWSLSRGRVRPALRIAGSLLRYWMARAHIAEGRRWLARALDIDDEVSPARVQALLAAAFLACLHYDIDDARARAGEALAIARAARHDGGTFWALDHLAFAAAMDGDGDEAEVHIGEALAIPSVSQEPLSRAWSLNFLALAHQARGQYEDQRAVLEESLELCRDAGDPMGVEWAYGYAGSAAFGLGEFEEARRLLGASLQISQRIGNWWGKARNLAAAGLATGDSETGCRQMQESLETFGRLGDRAGVAFCLRAIADWAGGRLPDPYVGELVDLADAIGADVRRVPVLGHLAEREGQPKWKATAGTASTLIVLGEPTIEDAVRTGAAALAELSGLRR